MDKTLVREMEQGAENYTKFLEEVRKVEEGLWSTRDRVEERSDVLDKQEKRIVQLEDMVRSLITRVAELEANQCRGHATPTEQENLREELDDEIILESGSSSRNRDVRVTGETTVREGTSREGREDIPWDRVEGLTLTAVENVGPILGRYPMVSSFSYLRIKGLILLKERSQRESRGMPASRFPPRMRQAAPAPTRSLGERMFEEVVRGGESGSRNNGCGP